MSPRKLLFFVNPRAGKGEFREHCLAIIELLTQGGFSVTLHPTTRREEIADLLPLMAPQFDLVAVCGGDGTLNEAVTGIMQLSPKQRPPLGYIPAGTVNDFATSLGISKDPLEAASGIVHGIVHACDVGRFSNRYFSYVAAFGAFTEVAYQTSQTFKNLLGRTAYLLEGISRLSQLKPYHMLLRYDGGSVEGDFLFGMVSNATSIGGIKLSGAQDISMSDGLLEVLLVRNPDNLVDVPQAVSAVLRQDMQANQLVAFRTTRLSIESPDFAPWTLDGEFGGNPARVEIENCLHALHVLV